MSRFVAPPNLTWLKRSSGTSRSEVVSAPSSFPKFRRSLTDLLRPHSFTKLSIEMFAGQWSVVSHISSGIEQLAKW